MSFRVLFLRMVWVVAAALALSGCDKEDDKKTEPGDDKYALSITKPTLTVGTKHKVTFTLKKGTKGVKDAEINGTMKCGTEKSVKGTTNTNGSVELEFVFDSEIAKDADCTINASYKPAKGDEVKATEVTVKVGEAGTTTTDPDMGYNIEFKGSDGTSNFDKITTAGELQFSLLFKKIKDTNASIAADSKVAIKVSCGDANHSEPTTDTSSAWKNPPTSASGAPAADKEENITNDNKTAAITVHLPDNTSNAAKCFVQACAPVGKLTGTTREDKCEHVEGFAAAG